MLPQDGRSPFEQQRWLDAENVDEVDIPPFGCVEVATSIVIGDRTILQVKRPTKDGLPNVMLNGMATMPAGMPGFVTRDYPAFALAAGSEGDMMGSQANAFDLKANLPGFIILGQGQDGQGQRRVMYYYPASLMFRGKLSAKMCSGDSLGNLDHTVKSTAACTTLNIPSALNVFGLAGYVGDPVLIIWSCPDDDYVIIQVKHFEVELINNIRKDNGCTIEKNVYKIAAMWCEDPTYQTAIAFYSTPVVVDLRLTNTIDRVSGVDTGDCKEQVNVQNVCTLNDISGNAPNWVDKITFAAVPALNNIALNGNQIDGTWVDIYAPCYTAPYTSKLLDLENCSSGSGSSGSG